MTLLLFVLGLLVVAVLGRSVQGERRARRAAEARNEDLKRIYRLAELAVHAEDALEVVLAARDELTSLLDLHDCRFEAPPFATALERLERSGAVSWQQYRLVAGGFALPADGVELPVVGRGRLLGRFVLVPTPDRGVSLEQRIAALAIADQVGLALAAPQPGREIRHG